MALTRHSRDLVMTLLAIRSLLVVYILCCCLLSVIVVSVSGLNITWRPAPLPQHTTSGLPAQRHSERHSLALSCISAQAASLATLPTSAFSVIDLM